jgi:hypothetical protein
MLIDDESAVGAVTYNIQGYISQAPRQNVTERSEVTLETKCNNGVVVVKSGTRLCQNKLSGKQ